MDNQTLAGIVTYNPDLDRLKDNLNAICFQVNKIIIVDNGSNNYDEIESFENSYSNLKILHNDVNVGIAKALNQIGDFADYNGYNFFLTLDQDSIAGDNLVAELKSCFKDNCIGMVCPYINRNNDYKFNDRVSEVFSCITSGCMVNTHAWKSIDGFWEYLFIDEVDHEFCYQLRANGYKILQTERTSIEHIIGTPSVKVVLGHKFHPTNHSAFRRYYITRNCILMKLLYPNEHYPFDKRYLMLFRIFVSTLMCEKNKCQKVKAMISGAKDALAWYKKNKYITTRRVHEHH